MNEADGKMTVHMNDFETRGDRPGVEGASMGRVVDDKVRGGARHVTLKFSGPEYLADVQRSFDGGGPAARHRVSKASATMRLRIIAQNGELTVTQHTNIARSPKAGGPETTTISEAHFELCAVE